MRTLLSLVILSSLLYSCSKPGEGGGATIVGTVYRYLIAPNGDTIEKELAIKEDVFIIYGDNVRYDDDYDTHFDGTYQFRYLKKGNYRVFAYEDCDTCASQKEQVFVQIEILKGKESFVAPDIELIENIDYDDGSAIIRGQHLQGPDLNVYITRLGDDTAFDSEKAGPQGYYEFKDLIPGKYFVAASDGAGNIGIPVLVNIKNKGQISEGVDVDV